MKKKKLPDKLTWSQDARLAFANLKERLANDPIICLPDGESEYVLRTDASKQGLGAVLLQERKGELMPIAYASKKLHGAELNYSTVEKECLAVVWGIQKFERYLYGRHFTIQTDHQPLQCLQRIKPNNGRLMRWAMHLQQYTFKVQVIPGKENIGADYLSRATEV